MGNKVYIIGGSDENGTDFLSSMECFDGDEISTLAPMNVQRRHFTALEIHGQIVVIGGEDHVGCGYLANDIDVYDVQSDQWFSLRQPVPGEPKKYPMAVWQCADKVNFEMIQDLFAAKAREEKYFEEMGLEWDYELNDWVQETVFSQ